MKLTIRPAKPTDADGIAALDPHKRRAKIGKAIADGACMLAEDGGMPVGFAVLTYNFYDNGFIELLIAREHYRRQGVGGALLAACAKKCETAKLFVSTNESNAAMRALLEKEGFVPCGVIYGLDEGDPERFYLKRLK